MDQQTRRWTTQETYGGKLAENCVQAIARDCLAEAIERLERAGYPIVFHVHDELVCETPRERADLDAVARLMSNPSLGPRAAPGGGRLGGRLLHEGVTTMQSIAFDQYIQLVMDHCQETLTAKAGKYATEDRLHNFKGGGRTAGGQSAAGPGRHDGQAHRAHLRHDQHRQGLPPRGMDGNHRGPHQLPGHDPAPGGRRRCVKAPEEDGT